jgi:hypothetical protein
MAANMVIYGPVVHENGRFKLVGRKIFRRFMQPQTGNLLLPSRGQCS